MEPFEYVVVLTSIILGLGIAQLLRGAADQVANWHKFVFSWSHGMYVIVLFLIHIQEWWITFQYNHMVTTWSLPLVLSILTFPILLFIQARMVFPSGTKSHEMNMVTYFMEQWRGLYIIGAMTVLISILQNYFISAIGFFEQIPLITYFIVYIIFILFRIKQMTLHLIFISLQLLGWIIYIGSENHFLH